MTRATQGTLDSARARRHRVDRREAENLRSRALAASASPPTRRSADWRLPGHRPESARPADGLWSLMVRVHIPARARLTGTSPHGQATRRFAQISPTAWAATGGRRASTATLAQAPVARHYARARCGRAEALASYRKGGDRSHDRHPQLERRPRTRGRQREFSGRARPTMACPREPPSRLSPRTAECMEPGSRHLVLLPENFVFPFCAHCCVVASTRNRQGHISATSRGRLRPGHHPC